MSTEQFISAIYHENKARRQKKVSLVKFVMIKNVLNISMWLASDQQDNIDTASNRR
jgi:hypothetical protein